MKSGVQAERLISFTTRRRDGDARAPGALKRILKSAHLPVHAATARQVHGTLVRVVKPLRALKIFSAADGLLTDAVNQPLGIYTADCVPLFLSAGKGRVVGLLHAGWRGVRGNILRQAARLIWKRWRLKASEIHAWGGPAIGPCCFHVQWDVARYFPSTRQRIGDRWTVDLTGEIRRQARRAGIHWVSQKASGDCTMHQKRYHSYRRNQTGKRQVSVMMKKEKWDR